MGELTKATFIKATKKGNSFEFDQSNSFKCQFNPTELKLGKGNCWNFKTNIGEDVPEAVFGGGTADSLEIDLLFDSTSEGTDVKEKYALLMKLASVDTRQVNESTQKGQPPYVVFHWGSYKSKVSVIEKITESYTMFLANGTPVRANVSVTMKEVEDDKKGAQNPTSHSEARKMWVVQHGQRLDWIAFEEYGDAAAWRHIAKTNGISNPRAIHAGQILKLVPLS